MPTEQLGLPFDARKPFVPEAYVIGSSNGQAATFVKSWPGWNVPAAAIYGPAGSGKSHLAAVWQKASGARIIAAEELDLREIPVGPAIIEDCDTGCGTEARALGMFHILERATPASPVLLTGRNSPCQWQCALPDLASRFSAMPAFGLRMPDNAMLATIVHGLFTARQLVVPEAVVKRVLNSVERTPAAIGHFVEELDRTALAQSRNVNLGLVRELLEKREKATP